MDRVGKACAFQLHTFYKVNHFDNCKVTVPAVKSYTARKNAANGEGAIAPVVTKIILQ